MKTQTRVLIGSITGVVTFSLATWFWQTQEVELQRTPAGTTGVRAGAVWVNCNDLYQTLCEGKLGDKDPTGEVLGDSKGEARAQSVADEVHDLHPDWSERRVSHETAHLIYTPERRALLRRAYRWTLLTLDQIINDQPEEIFSETEKQQLKTRLHQAKLQLPGPPNYYDDEPELLTHAEAYYERLMSGEMRLRIGGGIVMGSRSWFNLIFTFAHELSHAIDPCEVRSARLAIPSYDRVSACFLRQNLIAARRTRGECDKNDQLSETFADWMAVQVVATALVSEAGKLTQLELIHALANSVRDLCEDDGDDLEIDVEVHPSPQTRIDRIFGRNPSILKLLGCEPHPVEAPYCSFSWKNP